MYTSRLFSSSTERFFKQNNLNMTYRDQFVIHYPEDNNYSFQPHLFELPLIQDTQRCWNLNGLYQSLSLIGHSSAQKQMLRYNLGTSKWFNGSNISWQQKGKSKNYFAGGLVERFDPVTGLACDNNFTTVHDIFLDQFSIDVGKSPVPDLFGNHLLTAEPGKRVIICVNQITALVGSHYFDQFIWLATPRHPLVDLKGPAFITALPTDEPILLLAEMGYEQEWLHTASVVNTFLQALGKRPVHLLFTSSVCDPSIPTSRWIHDCSNEALTSIEKAFIETLKPEIAYV